MKVSPRATTSDKVASVADGGAAVLDNVVLDAEPEAIVAEFWRELDLGRLQNELALVR